MRSYPRTEVLRINRRRAVTLIVLTWCLGVAVAIKPLAKISVYTSKTYYNPIRPIKDIPHSYEMNIALSLWGMVAYFAIVPLYIKIFISVKKTSEQAGTRRDGSVAKKICHPSYEQHVRLVFSSNRHRFSLAYD